MNILFNIEVVSAIFVTLFVLVCWFFKSYQKTLISNTKINICENPGCIRCTSNQTAQQHAINVFNKKSYTSLKRLKCALEVSCKSEKYILYCDFIRKKEIWDPNDLPDSYQQDINNLITNLSLIKEEFKKANFFDGRRENWSKIFFMNQGTYCESVVKLYPETWKILSNCDNLMRDCLFGYQFFSALKPGSTIDEHVGPTNTRLRCHLSIQIPKLETSDKCYLEVNRLRNSWNSDGMIIFDDSFTHNVVYDSDCFKLDRIVLLLDFWHPDITETERNCISKCFSPM